MAIEEAAPPAPCVTHFVATSAGMPGVPRVELPHPVAGTGQQRMAEVATQVAAAITAALSAEPTAA